MVKLKHFLFESYMWLFCYFVIVYCYSYNLQIIIVLLKLNILLYIDFILLFGDPVISNNILYLVTSK
jgi:hypothetical protein